jgi:tetratricopeptide (TPR) repeat protein
MTAYSRIRRQQLLQEAEGYLDLVLVLGENWPLSPPARDRVARRALNTLSRLGESDASHHHALYLKGQAYKVLGQYQDAIEPLRQAVDLDPDNIHIHLSLAWCYKRVGKLDLAIQSLEDALDADRTEGIIHYNLACYWSLARNVGLTLAYLAQAFEMDANYRDMVADEPDFDPVRNHPEFVALTSVIV